MHIGEELIYVNHLQVGNTDDTDCVLRAYHRSGTEAWTKPCFERIHPGGLIFPGFFSVANLAQPNGTVVESLVMVCDRSVLELNGRDGSVLWRTNEQDQSIHQQPVVAEGGTVIVTGYGETGTPWIVFALRGGQEVWRVDMPPASLWRLGGVTTSDGVTYIQRDLQCCGPYSGRDIAVDAVSSNGTTLWTFDPSKSFVV